MRKPRGIAIIATLLVAAIMMMLAAVFLKLNQAQFSFTVQGEKAEMALEAAQSGLNYCLMRLETNRQWGHSGAERIRSRNGQFEVHEIDSLETIGGAKNFVSVGVFDGGQSHFQVVFPHDPVPAEISSGCFSDEDIQNNPNGGTGQWRLDKISRGDISCNNFVSDDPDGDVNLIPPPGARGNSLSPGRAVPAYRATIQVIGYSHGVRRVIEVTFRNALFTKSAMGAAGEMAIHCRGAWYLDNVGADRPVVESQGNLFLPNDDSNPNRTLARAIGSPGKITAQGDVRTGGEFAPTINPTSGGIDLFWNRLSNAPTNFSTLGSFMNASVNPRTVVPAQKKPDIDLMDRLLSKGRSRTVSIDPGTYRFKNPNTVDQVDDSGNVIRTLSGQVGGLEIKNYRIEVPDGTRVNVAGNLKLTRASTSLPKPVIALGYEDGLLPRPNKAKGASLNVQNGSLAIDGHLVGNGSVVVNTTNPADTLKSTISVTANSNVNGIESAGVAMYADGNIQIAGPKPEDALNNSADWEVVGKALDRFAQNENRWYAFENNWFARSTGTNQRLNLLEGHETRTVIFGGSNSSSSSSTTGSASGSATGTATGGSNGSNTGTNGNGGTGEPQVVIGRTPDLKDYPVPATELKKAVSQMVDQYRVSTWTTEQKDQLLTNLRTVFGNDFDLQFQQTQVDVILPSANGATVTDYLRVREHLKKFQAAISDNSSLPTEVVSMTGSDAANNIMRDINWFSRQARENEATPWMNPTPLKKFVRENENPLNFSSLLNSTMEGLVYSASSVLVNPGRGNFRMIGSILAGKDLVVTDANQMVTVYDPQYISKFTGFQAGRLSGSRLDQDYFRIR